MEVVGVVRMLVFPSLETRRVCATAYTTPIRELLLCVGSINTMKGGGFKNTMKMKEVILCAHKVCSYAFT